MFRLLLIVFLLSGCAATENKPLTISNKEALGKIGVISTIGDDLLCKYIGFTIFNNKENNYKIPNKFNEVLTTKITEKLSNLNFVVEPLNSDLVTYKKDEKGASSFKNIKFNESVIAAKSIDTLVIYDGSLRYNSTGGYYARENALNTFAGLYVYSLSSKKLIGVSSMYKTDLKRKFSCELDSLSPTSDMFNLIEKSGLEIQKELVNNVFVIAK
ncbi:hypothetical protein ACM9HF_04575 [Colwellia sp. RE-S-Sl-9]